MSSRSASEHSKVDMGSEDKDKEDWTVKGGKKYLVVLKIFDQFIYLQKILLVVK